MSPVSRTQGASARGGRVLLTTAPGCNQAWCESRNENAPADRRDDDATSSESFPPGTPCRHRSLRWCHCDARPALSSRGPCTPSRMSSERWHCARGRCLKRCADAHRRRVCTQAAGRVVAALRRRAGAAARITGRRRVVAVAWIAGRGRVRSVARIALRRRVRGRARINLLLFLVVLGCCGGCHRLWRLAGVELIVNVITVRVASRHFCFLRGRRVVVLAAAWHLRRPARQCRRQRRPMLMRHRHFPAIEVDPRHGVEIAACRGLLMGCGRSACHDDDQDGDEQPQKGRSDDVLSFGAAHRRGTVNGPLPAVADDQYRGSNLCLRCENPT